MALKVVTMCLDLWLIAFVHEKILPCQCKISFFDIENDDDNPIKREWINAQNFITT